MPKPGSARPARSMFPPPTASPCGEMRETRQQVDGTDLVEYVRRALAVLAGDGVAGRNGRGGNANESSCPHAAHNPESTATTQHERGASLTPLSVAQTNPRVTA